MRKQTYQGGTAQSPPPPPPPAATAQRRRPEPWVYWLVGALALALIGTVVALVVSGGDKTAASSTTAGPGERVGEVFREPTGSLGPDPYTDRVLEAAAVATTAPILPTTTPTTAAPTTAAPTTAGPTTTAPTTAAPGTVVLASRSGGEPGLYGGTLDQTRCDKEGMLSFLEQNPAKAAAWVMAQNSDPNLRWDTGRTSLTVADLRAYFAELTPVTLLYDTRVTNHGFRNGLPTPRQSVLQAGTAVLVDIYGVPRARCACGNPLIPPLPSPVPPTYVGPPWPGFDPTIIIVVVPAPVIITNVVIIDMNTGILINRPTGTSGDQDAGPPDTAAPPDTSGATLTIPPDIVVGTGDVQITLLWATDSDMDLHVIDPSGVEIYFSNRQSATGGQLDVDNIPREGDTATHVENVFWPTGGAPPGAYSAFVRHFNSRNGASTYIMEVRVGGQLIHQESGSIEEFADSTPFGFQVNPA